MRGEHRSRFDVLPGLTVLVLFLSCDFDKSSALVMFSSELGRGGAAVGMEYRNICYGIERQSS